MSPWYSIRVFSEDECTASQLADVDIVAFPGGIGDSDSFDKLLRPCADVVRSFVATGGRYLGICMGAYWAGHHYFDLLDGVQAEQYIKRPGADVRRSFSTTSRVTWLGETHDMFFYDGCSLLGDASKFDVIAAYPNGDAMAIMQNRIGVIGCHPESMQYWYDKPYLRDRWHDRKHHTLLKEFVDNLMQR